MFADAQLTRPLYRHADLRRLIHPDSIAVLDQNQRLVGIREGTAAEGDVVLAESREPVVLSETGLIGDGDSPLTLTVTDEAGNTVCTLPPGLAPALCRFTPARNKEGRIVKAQLLVALDYDTRVVPMAR